MHLINFISTIQLLSVFPPTNTHLASPRCPTPFASCPGPCCMRDNYVDKWQDIFPVPRLPTCRVRFYLRIDGTFFHLPSITFTMGGKSTKEENEEKTVTEESAIADREDNSGLKIFDVHINCAGGTLMALFLLLVAVVLIYMGYKKFCAKKKKTGHSSHQHQCDKCESPGRWDASRRFFEAMDRSMGGHNAVDYVEDVEADYVHARPQRVYPGRPANYQRQPRQPRFIELPQRAPAAPQAPPAPIAAPGLV